MLAKMDRPCGLFVAAVVLYTLSLVEVAPSFVPGAVFGTDVELAVTRQLRGGAPAMNLPLKPTSGPLACRGMMQAASTFLVLSACALASRGSASKMQMRAITSPNSVFMLALTSAAKKTKESVAVTKDCMKIKHLLKDRDFLDEMLLFVAIPRDQLEQADGFIKRFQPLESTVMPKFIRYLAKKKRLEMLKSIVGAYITLQYRQQDIEPVIVKSAQPLSEGQKKKIADKMKAKLDVKDVKLVCEVDSALLAGFTLEWGFRDPETLEASTQGIELTLKANLESAAINAQK